MEGAPSVEGGSAAASVGVGCGEGVAVGEAVAVAVAVGDGVSVGCGVGEGASVATGLAVGVVEEAAREEAAVAGSVDQGVYTAIGVLVARVAVSLLQPLNTAAALKSAAEMRQMFTMSRFIF